MARMRIAFLLQDTGRIYGAERATLDLARGLRSAGVEVAAWLIEESRLGLEKSQLKAAILDAGLPCVALPVQSAFSRDLLRALREKAGSERPDIVHTIGPKATVHAAWALRGRLPLVTTVHGWLFRPDLKERFYEWLELRAFRRFDRVITLSRHYEHWLAARVGAGRVVRIPSGFQTRGEAESVAAVGDRGHSLLKFGMLGRLSWEKNHELFFRAARRFLDGGGAARFLVAGEGPERARLETLRAELGLETDVEMAGYAASEEFFRNVHALVQCSRMENLPYSIMEAMARERPVLATRVGGIPDLIEDGVSGFLVEPGDEAALAERMTRLADDPGLVVRMGKAGREKLEREFATGKNIEDHIKLYTALRPLNPEP
ncbi:MAG: glycosyltransferase [Kiritimatiellae bacterium]|nr:glycosyltransferase [Kiritimatiellia bacterium]